MLCSGKTANDFEDGYPVGNGKIGVMFFGGPGRLCFVINHSNLWHCPKIVTKKGGGEWGKVRELANSGKWVECSEIAPKVFKDFKVETGDNFGSFQPGTYFGTVGDTYITR